MRNAPAPIKPRTAAPPTNPPTIAPVSLDFLLLFEDPVGPTVAEFVEEVVELAEEELDEDFEEDFEALEELEELDAAELSRTARAIDLKGREELSPENVVKAVCQVDSSFELQKYCATVAPGAAYKILAQNGAELAVLSIRSESRPVFWF